MSTRALVTGGTGYTGSHLVDRLRSRGDEVYVLARSSSDLGGLELSHVVTFDSANSDYPELQEIFSEVRPDVVFHLAAEQTVNHTPEDIRPLVESNILLATLVAEASSTAAVKSFVNAGTFLQRYGDRPYSPSCLYAATKQAFVDMLGFYVEVRQLPAVTVEVPDTYGPRDPRPKLLSLIAEAQATGKSLAVSPGEQVLDFMHVADVVDGLIAAAELVSQEPSHAGRTYALHSSEQRCLRDVIGIWEEVTETPVPVVFGGRPYREREMMVPTSTPLLPGWSPKLNLHAGFAQVQEANEGVAR